jgi:hypothetical protein
MTDTGKPPDTEQPASTGKTDDDGGLEYVPALLIFPAAVVLTFWHGVGWAAWTAVVVGLIGMVLIPITFYRGGRNGKFEWWAFLGTAFFTAKFVAGAWTVLF